MSPSSVNHRRKEDLEKILLTCRSVIKKLDSLSMKDIDKMLDMEYAGRFRWSVIDRLSRRIDRFDSDRKLDLSAERGRS